MAGMAKPRKTSAERALVVPILGDAAMAGPESDGRMIPALILDTSSRPDLTELIRVHKLLPSRGDVRCQWATSHKDGDTVILHLTFERPVAAEALLLFSIEHQAILVESMLKGGGVYLQSGEAGDRVMHTLDRPRIMVELPDTGFRPVWDDLLMTRMTAVMARRVGLPRRKARPIADELIAEIRKLAHLRMGPP